MTTADQTRATWEPSAWMRARLAELVTQAQAAGLDPHNGPSIIVRPLGRTGRAGSREDRTCDRCRTYVPNGREFNAVAVPATPRMVVCGGMCDPCADREGVTTW